jgi:hypothetical protein
LEINDESTSPARLKALSLALLCGFMRWRWLDRCCLHKSIVPAPPRKESLVSLQN